MKTTLLIALSLLVLPFSASPAAAGEKIASMTLAYTASNHGETDPCG